MRSNEDILKLLDRISSGQATDEDISEYSHWCDSFQVHGLPIPDVEEIKAAVLIKIRKRIHHESNIRRLNMWTKIAAVASVILVVAIGGYYLMQKAPSQPIASKQFNDKGPGANKAILTLANGQSIVLDSAPNGQLASQGNSQVKKIDSGLLAYQPLNAQRSQEAMVSYNTLTVPRGGQYRLILPDGTKVWLNAASSIRYPTSFTGKERKVMITGEVYMEVVEDAGHPFMVSTRSVDITVLGTHFNIMAYDNEPAVKTTLLEGSVRVSVRGKQVTTIIRPGQQAMVSNINQDINVKKVNAANVAAWIYGSLSLKDCSIQEFMNELSRWYDVDVDYNGDVPQQRFGGMINRNAPLSDVLAALNAAGIHTQLEGKKIMVLSH